MEARIEHLFKEYAGRNDFDGPKMALPLTVKQKQREAAVIMLIFWQSEEWHVVLTKRSLELSKHPGEVAFPGGMRESSDDTLLRTALREANEEIGLDPDLVRVVGQVEPTMTRFGVVVHPFVGIIDKDVVLTLKRNPSEVEQIFTCPLRIFLSSVNHSYVDYGPSQHLISTLRLHEFMHQGYRIQGITASILIRVASIILKRAPEYEFDYPVQYITGSKI